MHPPCPQGDFLSLCGKALTENSSNRFVTEERMQKNISQEQKEFPEKSRFLKKMAEMWFALFITTENAFFS